MKTFYVVYDASAQGGEETYLETDRQSAIAEAQGYADDIFYGNDHVEVIVAELVPVARVFRQVEQRVEDIPQGETPSRYSAGYGWLDTEVDG